MVCTYANDNQSQRISAAPTSLFRQAAIAVATSRSKRRVGRQNKRQSIEQELATSLLQVAQLVVCAVLDSETYSAVNAGLVLSRRQTFFAVTPAMINSQLLVYVWFFYRILGIAKFKVQIFQACSKLRPRIAAKASKLIVSHYGGWIS